ncbi:hypothetical protein [Peribacillus frigoritolerans]|uniref:hypothetical protein n=1 Tax=Peribacillus frigoritolerans TaxID=450367 RepID=UPI00216295C8|nr:hypothetical protein [Peribacillus frigoritolerans]
MFTPFVICLLLLGLHFKDVTSYTLLGILLGSILLFVKELSFTKLPMKNTTGLIKVIVLGLSAGLSIGILESVITNKNNQIVEFYKSLLSTDLTVGIPYLLLICIPVVLFRNRIFILDDMKNKLALRAKKSEEKNSSIIKGEFAKQLKTSNREGNFTNKFLNTLLLYGCFLITYYSSSHFLNSHFLFRKDTFFILSIVIASRNSKVFFNSRSIYSETTMIYSFLFSKYKISNILFYRVIINSLSTLVLNLSFIIPLYVMSHLEIEFLLFALLVSSIFSIALSCIQEYYLANKVLYLVSIGNENKGSMIKRILWESLLTMVVMYSYILTIVIDANLISTYSTITSLILLGLIIIFSIKILKGNKKFYGELKEYY